MDVVIIPLVVVDNTLDVNDFSVVVVALSVEINSSVAVDTKVCVVAVASSVEMNSSVAVDIKVCVAAVVLICV